MKVVILAGGMGTRISEESHLRPKPMIELIDMPILWHIMKCYSLYGYNDFIICAGYKAFLIKEFFANYYLYKSDVTFDFSKKNSITVHDNYSEPWKVTVVDTGLDTMTGGRIKRIQKYIGNETFLLTYGDGVSDLDINDLVTFHKHNNKKATVTAIQPAGRFGAIDLSDSGIIKRFAEKKREDGGWINGGFMVLEPDIFGLISGDSSILEKEPLEILASQGELLAYMYRGFWQCMDTLRDKLYLEDLIRKQQAPWIKWKI
jgi:glucose-1-phosphate cytidylyltransferase